jgi:hypothetical protein
MRRYRPCTAVVKIRSENIRSNLIWVIPAQRTHSARSCPLTSSFFAGYSYCITIAAAVALYFVLWRENKRRAALQGLNDEDRDKGAFRDLTDRENVYFTYQL